MDSAVVGSMRIDYFRVGVFIDIFDKAISLLEQQSIDADATRRILALGSRDSTTGWRAMTYTTATVKAIRVPRGNSYSLHGAGFYAHEDAMFLVADPCNLGDQFLTTDGTYYQIQTKQQHSILDSHLCYEYQCSELPLWQAAPSSTATWSTTPYDPRNRAKTWIEDNDTPANITKDDGSTEASYAVIFANPPYSLEAEFRASSSPVNGLYAVGQPNSIEMMSSKSRTAYGYIEHTPIHIYTVDSTGCHGDKLLWDMDRELRNINENNALLLGNLRYMRSRKPDVIILGGTRLYHLEYELTYRRDVD